MRVCFVFVCGFRSPEQNLDHVVTPVPDSEVAIVKLRALLPKEIIVIND